MSRRSTVAIAAVITGALLGRLSLTARDELRAGEAAFARHDPERGVLHLRRAAHAYWPGNPWVEAAYARLEEEALAAETRGQPQTARDAWSALRASALGTRWMVVPQRARLDRANHHLAHLLAVAPPPPEERDVAVSTREERHLALLQEDRSPDPAWVLVTGLGLALWLAAGVWAARHGWDAEHRAQRHVLWRAGAAVLLGFGLFVLGLWRA
ncbi:MAG: hypothetical protein JNK72_21235 [Myxococcales bacterium]|nr:hypothetical protein [Myxococcales bacterium]